jgi:hypothetical protein
VPHRIELTTELDAPAERVWSAMQHPAAMLYVCRGLVGLPGLEGRTEPIVEGEQGSGWIFLFHTLPLARYHIVVEDVDPATRTIRTVERGGMLSRLVHTFSVDDVNDIDAGDAGRCSYRDLVEIDAGHLTPLVASFAELLYRYRQARWRRLAQRHLSGPAPSSSGHTTSPVREPGEDGGLAARRRS